MSYTPHMQVQYRIAEAGEISEGRTVELKDGPDGQVLILLAAGEVNRRVPVQISRLSTHQVVHGTWRERRTCTGPLARPQDLGLAVCRWETVPGRLLPKGRDVVGIEEDGMCTWVVDGNACTARLRDEMNALFQRLAEQGVWLQVWLRHRSTSQPAPLRTAPAGTPFVTV